MPAQAAQTIDGEHAAIESMQRFLQTWNSSISGQVSKYSVDRGGRDDFQLAKVTQPLLALTANTVPIGGTADGN